MTLIASILQPLDYGIIVGFLLSLREKESAR